MITTDHTVRAGAERARKAAAQIADPELPMLSLSDLGILRDVRFEEGTLVVVITPTYTGCPAIATIRSDLLRTLHADGFDTVDIRTSLSPPWSSDWISVDGRQKLAEHGISPPGPADDHGNAATSMTLIMPDRLIRCPHCASFDSYELSHFSASACRALRVCRSCSEPFEHFKEL